MEYFVVYKILALISISLCKQLIDAAVAQFLCINIRQIDRIEYLEQEFDLERSSN